MDIGIEWFESTGMKREGEVVSCTTPTGNIIITRNNGSYHLDLGIVNSHFDDIKSLINWVDTNGTCNMYEAYKLYKRKTKINKILNR